MSGATKSKGRCVICGKDAVRNHVGGQNHVAWFTMPYCPEHHAQFHALVTAAGINLEYTSDPLERLLCGLQACLLAEWVLTKELQELDSRPDKKIAAENLRERGL
jgi:hypothetical protein